MTNHHLETPSPGEAERDIQYLFDCRVSDIPHAPCVFYNTVTGPPIFRKD